MRDYITAQTVANQVRMSSSVFGGAYGIVEGSLDAVFFRHFLRDATCRVVPATGKSKAVDALALLKGFGRAFAIVDADDWHVTGECPEADNLFVTDAPDIETMIMQADSFVKVVRNRSDEAALQSFLERRKINDLRAVLLMSCQDLGYLRLVNKTKGYDLQFKDLYFEGFVDADSLKIDTKKLATLLRNNSHSKKATAAELLEDLKQAKKKQCDPWLVVCGHDLVKVFAIGLSQIFGFNRARKKHSVEDLEREMRLALEGEEFRRTSLYTNLKAWEKTYGGEPILK
jgi:hypothetical protein